MFPLLLQPRPSRQARLFLLLLHLAAVAALFVAALPPWLRLIALLGVAGSYFQQPAASIRLRALGDGRLEVNRGDSWRRVELQADSIALPGLIVLTWREEGRRRHLPLPGDALDRDDHRRLRVWLRWRARYEAKPEALPPAAI